LSTAGGSVIEIGQSLFAENCSSCHGDFGEGGPNPSRPDDIIAPISTAEYLKTRDNHTLQQIISQGQPNFGMSPFSAAYGGPLDDDEINALVAFIRSWEDDPPVDLPPEVTITGDLSLEGDEIFDSLCYQCHGPSPDGVRQGPSLATADFQESRTDQEIFDAINLGHEATSMIAWGEILTSEQITQLVDFIRNLPEEDESAAGISFSRDVLPILEDRCAACHDSPNGDGGWDATSYDGVINTGDNAPVIVPGDVDNSLLAQKLLGTQEEGDPMPPLISLSDRKVQVILDWIAAGAPNN
jgi:mono/diheme cytochrome c family protein